MKRVFFVMGKKRIADNLRADCCPTDICPRYIAVCYVNMSVYDVIFTSLCSRLYCIFDHIRFVIFIFIYFYYGNFLLSCKTFLSLSLRNPAFYQFKKLITLFFIKHCSNCTLYTIHFYRHNLILILFSWRLLHF